MWMKPVLGARVALLMGLLAVASWASSASAQLKTVELSVGMYRIQAEVAADSESRQVGLMHRKSMAGQAGMLFVFEEPNQHCFWMKNTLIPLTIAFLDDAGKIVNLADMQPETEDAHCAAKPVRYALEMNQGWFKSKGIAAGSIVRGIATPASR